MEDNKDLLSSEEVKEEEVSTEEVSEQPTAEVNESANETETPKVETETSGIDEEEKEESSEDPKKPYEDDNKETAESSEAEVSALTDYDLRQKLSRALDAVSEDLWINYLFPEEHKFWARSWKMSELEYLEFSYSVEEENVTLSEGVEIVLVASPTKINDVVAELNQQISERDDLILKSSEELTTLKAEIAELSVFKSQIEEIEIEKAEAEITAQREDLIASVIKSGMITQEELETSEEMKQMVSELDKKSLMSIVGERLAMSMTGKVEKSEVETSDVKTETVHIVTNLNNDDEVEISMKDKVASLRKSLRK